METWEWIEKRWYWIVGALLGLFLIYLWKHGQSASVQDTSSQGAVAAQSAVDPNILAASAGAQAAAVQAQSQASAAATAAAANVQIAQLQLAQQQDVDSANVNIAVSGNNSAEAINRSNNRSAVSIAQINGTTALGQTQAQVGGAVAMNQAQMDAAVAQTKWNDDAAMTINQSNNWSALQALLDNNRTALATTLSNNQTAVAGYTIQGQVANNAIDKAAGVDAASIAAQAQAEQEYYSTAGALSAQELAVQQQQWNAAASIIATGGLNKGGEGGINTMAGFMALMKQPAAAAVGAAAAGQVGTAQAQETASVVNSVMSTVGKLGTAFLA
jgi:hypothetical protein